MRIILTLVLACSLITVSAQNNSNTILASTSDDLAATKVETKPIAEARDSKLDSTKASFLKEVAANPTYVPSIDKLADFYRSIGNIDSTIYYYQKSLELKPRGIIARQSLAAAYLVTGNFDTSIKHYKMLQKDHPDYPEVYHGLGRVYLAKKDYQLAIKNSEVALRWYIAAKKNLHAADARLLMGKAYMYQRDYKTAIKYFKAGKKHYQDKAFYHYHIGYCYLYLKKDKLAKEYLSKAETMGYQLPVYVKNKLKKSTTD